MSTAFFYIPSGPDTEVAELTGIEIDIETIYPEIDYHFGETEDMEFGNSVAKLIFNRDRNKYPFSEYTAQDIRLSHTPPLNSIFSTFSSLRIHDTVITSSPASPKAPNNRLLSYGIATDILTSRNEFRATIESVRWMKQEVIETNNTFLLQLANSQINGYVNMLDDLILPRMIPLYFKNGYIDFVINFQRRAPLLAAELRELLDLLHKLHRDIVDFYELGEDPDACIIKISIGSAGRILLRAKGISIAVFAAILSFSSCSHYKDLPEPNPMTREFNRVNEDTLQRTNAILDKLEMDRRFLNDITWK